MGFSSTAGYLLLFMVVMGIFTVMIYTHSDIMDDKSSAMTSKDFRDTIIELEDIYTEGSRIIFSARNKGDTKLDPSKNRVYIDRYHNTETSVDNIINEPLWDPGEKANITINKDIESGKNYTATITTEYGESRKVRFINDISEAELLKSEKSSVPVQDTTEEVNESDDIRATISIPTGTNQYINYTFSVDGKSTVHEGNILVEHFFNESSDIREFQQYDDGWSTIGTLSPYTTEDNDTFTGDSLIYRHHYNSTKDVEAYVDYIKLEVNATRWFSVS